MLVFMYTWTYINLSRFDKCWINVSNKCKMVWDIVVLNANFYSVQKQQCGHYKAQNVLKRNWKHDCCKQNAVRIMYWVEWLEILILSVYWDFFPLKLKRAGPFVFFFLFYVFQRMENLDLKKKCYFVSSFY